MLKPKKRSWLARLFSFGSPVAKPQLKTDPMDDMGLLSPQAFKIEIQREILRSDRSNQPLTLLLIAVQGASQAVGEGEAYALLTPIVVGRMRRTDCLGWHEDQRGRRLGVLLWNTTADRVEVIIASLRQEFLSSIASTPGLGAKPVSLDYEVLVYPDEHDYGGAPQDPGAPARRVTSLPLSNDCAVAAAKRERHTPKALLTPGAPCNSLTALLARQSPSPPAWKRGMDLVLSAAILLLLSPVMAAIALAIKLTSPGPILFRQVRVGMRGQSFSCLKFRSMRHNYDCSGHREHLRTLITQGGAGAAQAEKPMEKLDKVNPHITRVGRIIRSSHLDELPQLFNVLQGDMSLVGPRPCIPYEAENYQQWCTRRFNALPGITGLWQVAGKNKTTFSEMIRLDLAYIRQCSPLLDLKIILLTIPTILADVRDNWSSRRGEPSNDLQKA